MFVVASNLEIKEESEKWIAAKKIGSQYKRKGIKIQMGVSPHPEGGNPAPGREISIQDAGGLDPIPKGTAVFTWGGAKWIYLARGTDIQEKNQVVDLFASFVADRKGRKGGLNSGGGRRKGYRFKGRGGSIPGGGRKGSRFIGGRRQSFQVALKSSVGNYP